MTTTLATSAAQKRHIPLEDFKPCAAAFIDQRNPNSEGKMNYSFIGPGVTQSASQEINLAEAHGFNVGGVTLPIDRVNNLHLHYTAEVFINVAGEWEFIWGNDGEHSATIGQFDTFTIPTWIFRGFLNRSAPEVKDPFLFAVLGGDDTGGIIWAPSVLKHAEEAGIRLSADSMMIDSQAGDKLPAGVDYIKPVDQDFLDKLPTFTPEQMEKFIIRHKNLDWRNDALPNNGLNGNASDKASLAPLLGSSMTSARHHWAPVQNPQGFSIDWLRIPAEATTGSFNSSEKQVAIVFKGSPQILINQNEKAINIDLAERSLYSTPAGCWREYTNQGSEEALILVINNGNERTIPNWSDKVLASAKNGGGFLDADNYLSPLAVIG